MSLGPQPPEYDADWVRAKYQAERDKRLRAAGVDQYVEVTADFSHYADDPYTERVDRAPVGDHVQVLIIGGGLGSLIAAARLRFPTGSPGSTASAPCTPSGASGHPRTLTATSTCGRRSADFRRRARMSATVTREAG